MPNMLKFLICVVFLVTAVAAIDKKTFKNCSRIEFCARLRKHYLSDNEKYKANFTSVKYTDTDLTIQLHNDKGKQLQMLVRWSTNVVRVIVTEPNNTRFMIPAGISLLMEPYRYDLVVTTSQDKLIIGRIGESNRLEIVNQPYFVMRALNYQRKEVLSLNADRLLMENTKTSQAFTFKVNFVAPKIYGLFNHAWKLSLGTTVNTSIDPFRMRNSDSWGYEANSPMALYGVVPAIYGHTAQQTSGMFLHNAAEQWIDTLEEQAQNTTSAYFMVEGAAFDLFILFGPTPTDVVRQITQLTGKARIPQLWTLGYHQCRFSYKSQEDVKTVTARMVENDFPVDAIWIDGDHTEDYKWFQWNHTTYSNPIEMQKNISSYNKVCVTISDPHIKVDKNYPVYAGGMGKYFVKWSNGTDYQADCWPGASSWIDYFLPEAADYYSTWFAFNKFNGSTPTLAGIWNDMNEPAVFDESIEKTFPFELVHRLDSSGTTVKHKDVHNVYGIMHTKSTYKGLVLRDQIKKRPFILSRSTFAGSQRYAAMWTGDNTATWEHFANSLSECMTGNIFGMVFCGADIGGFIGDPSDELLQRWYQGAAWTPFFRGHSSRESKRREPFLFSKPVQEVLRNAIKLRYKHIPYLYTLFSDHDFKGDPVISPLFYRYPGIQERDHQILIGKDIMAVAVVKPAVKTVNVVFPGEKNEVWYQIDKDTWLPHFGGRTEDIPVDIKTSPVFYRGGSIILRNDDVKGSTFLMNWDELNVYVNCDLSGKASGAHFKDDLVSFNYVYQVSFSYWSISYNKTNKLTFKLEEGESKVFKAPKVKSLIVHSLNKTSDGYELVEEIFTKTRDGRNLRDIEISRDMTLSL